jgi:5-methylcytosine-specific restriction protein A
MPALALHRCAYPTCTTLTREKWCPAHTGMRVWRAAGSSRQVPEWLRKQVLEEEPLCQCTEHKGRDDAPASTIVDHIIPHKGDRALFLSRANLQGLAKRCHDRKTAREDGGFGRPMRRVS